MDSLQLYIIMAVGIASVYLTLQFSFTPNYLFLQGTHPLNHPLPGFLPFYDLKITPMSRIHLEFMVYELPPYVSLFENQLGFAVSWFTNLSNIFEKTKQNKKSFLRYFWFAPTNIFFCLLIQFTCAIPYRQQHWIGGRNSSGQRPKGQPISPHHLAWQYVPPIHVCDFQGGKYMGAKTSVFWDFKRIIGQCIDGYVGMFD